MNTKSTKKQKKQNPPENKYCNYCDKTGIVHETHFNELGVDPLAPCPKCVISKCTCNSEEPYYYFKNGKIKECFCRETRMRIERIKNIYLRSGINRKYLWKFFNDFQSLNKSSADAKNTAYDIVQNFPDVRKGLFLWGSPGTGKTLLASILLTELIIRHAVEGRFVSISRNFFKSLQETFVEGSATYGESGKIEKELADVDILVIDDFGVQKDSEWKQETLYDLVDARYVAEKFTIFTSNLDPHKALKEMSHGRILSRIKEMSTIMEISGGDFREKL